MKGEKITNLYDLIHAIETKQKILGGNGDARRLEDYTIKQLQTELDDGLYIKQEPEVPKCPYCKVEMTLDNEVKYCLYWCGNTGCPVHVHGPKRDTPEKAAEALKLQGCNQLTDEDLLKMTNKYRQKFGDDVSRYYEDGLFDARDKMEGKYNECLDEEDFKKI